MEAFVWNDSFTTGLSTVDQQHHFLLDLINRVGRSLVEEVETDSPAVDQVFGQLADYASYHFAEEERLMIETGVDTRHSGRHCQNHRRFIDQVSRMWSSRKSMADPCRMLHSFLSSWLSFHILAEDQAMARQIKLIQTGEAPARAYEIVTAPKDDSAHTLLIALRNLDAAFAEQNKSLTEANLRLEQRVDERTRELAKTNQELVEANRQLEALNATLEQQVRERTATLERAVRDLDAFAYSASHDLRAPLRAINGYCEILLEDEQHRLSDDGKKTLARISHNCGTLGQLITDILDYSRAGSIALNVGEVDLSQLVNSVADDLRTLYAKTTIAAAALPTVPGDATMLHEIFQNLIENACKFSSAKERPTVEIGVRQVGAETIFYVKDNGVGFEQRHADKLFGVFQRLHTDARYPGTGVGLAIVKRLIDRHRGRIWAESKPGEGAMFYFTLGSNKSQLMANVAG